MASLHSALATNTAFNFIDELAHHGVDGSLMLRCVAEEDLAACVMHRIRHCLNGDGPETWTPRKRAATDLGSKLTLGKQQEMWRHFGLASFTCADVGRMANNPDLMGQVSQVLVDTVQPSVKIAKAERRGIYNQYTTVAQQIERVRRRSILHDWGITQADIDAVKTDVPEWPTDLMHDTIDRCVIQPRFLVLRLWLPERDGVSSLVRTLTELVLWYQDEEDDSRNRRDPVIERRQRLTKYLAGLNLRLMPGVMRKPGLTWFRAGLSSGEFGEFKEHGPQFGEYFEQYATRLGGVEVLMMKIMHSVGTSRFVCMPTMVIQKPELDGYSGPDVPHLFRFDTQCHHECGMPMILSRYTFTGRGDEILLQLP